MGWWHNRYRERPAAKNKSARIAWDCLAEEAAELNPPRTIDKLWYASEMEAWNALLNPVDGDPEHYIEIDVLCVADRRNNPHKYATDGVSAAGPQIAAAAPPEQGAK